MLFLLLALFSLFFLDFSGEPFVLLALGEQVVEVKDAYDVFLLEDELLNLAGDDGGNSAGLFPVFEEDDGGQLPGQRRRADVERIGHVLVASGVDFACWVFKNLVLHKMSRSIIDSLTQRAEAINNKQK